MRGGSELGALTLGRWYVAHVLLLPAALAGLVAAHVYLMRRHGISGPIVPHAGAPTPFYPAHALKDTIAVAATFAALLTFAFIVPAPLDEMADPSDDTYVPRPEWYFLSLFQLLKYFPGPLEPVATMVIPGLVVGGLLLLPWLDRANRRHPLKRLSVMFTFGVAGTSTAASTTTIPSTRPAARMGPPRESSLRGISECLEGSVAPIPGHDEPAGQHGASPVHPCGGEETRTG